MYILLYNLLAHPLFRRSPQSRVTLSNGHHRLSLQPESRPAQQLTESKKAGLLATLSAMDDPPKVKEPKGVFDDDEGTAARTDYGEDNLKIISLPDRNSSRLPFIFAIYVQFQLVPHRTSITRPLHN